MSTDIEIAQKATIEKATQIAKKLGINDDHLEPYGHYKAKISLDYLDSLKSNADGKLVLVLQVRTHEYDFIVRLYI